MNWVHFVSCIGDVVATDLWLGCVDLGKQARDGDLPEDKRRWTSAGNCEEDADLQCRVSLKVLRPFETF